MLRFDDSQKEVFGLDSSRHARILGAPGSGKTTILVEALTRLVSEGELQYSELLVFSPSRSTASKIRNQLETQTDDVLPGGLVRSPESFAFATLARLSAIAAEPGPRLLTGAAQDDLIKEVLEPNIKQLAQQTGFSEELLSLRVFRDELRDFERILSDHRIDKKTLFDLAKNPQNWISHQLSQTQIKEIQQLVTVWTTLFSLTEKVHELQNLSVPNTLSSTQLISFCTEAVNTFTEENDIQIPRLVLIDDAEDLTRGALNLLAALANRGSAIWAFGDPDMSTGAFQGKNTRLMQGINFSLRDVRNRPNEKQTLEQVVVLKKVYRHGSNIREVVSNVVNRIGISGISEHRNADCNNSANALVQFTKTSTSQEQAGVIAHRLRSARFGVDAVGDVTSWSDMVVICRSQQEVAEVQKSLGHLDVPTRSGSGGVTLKDHSLVRDLITVLLHVLGVAEIDAKRFETLLIGPLGGFDKVSLRKLKQEMSLQEQQLITKKDLSPSNISEVIFSFLPVKSGNEIKVANSKLARFLNTIQSGLNANLPNAQAREVLWAIWDAANLSNQLLAESLEGEGTVSQRANSDLDAVLNLFYILQRHEEQADTTPVSDVLIDLLTSDVAQDTLADAPARDAVLVTTVQGVAAQSFDLVCVLGPQEGVWPNLRSRGSLLQLSVLETLLTDGTYGIHDRTETLHDELRLFAVACSRAVKQLLVVAVASENEFPSAFYTLGRKFEVVDLPHSRFSIRGFIADLRRELELEPTNEEVAVALAVLAQHNIDGADPDQWYGIQENTNLNPLVDLEGDPDATVSVSPSKIEAVEECPLNWVINDVGGGPAEISARLGSLIHEAFEKVLIADEEAMTKIIDAGWEALDFESEWQSKRQYYNAQKMIKGINDYLTSNSDEHRVLLNESFFQLKIGQVVLRGFADRVEMRTTDEGLENPVILDLKTGATVPTKKEVEDHAQLQSYQAGLLFGEFTQKNADSEESSVSFGSSAGAYLLYVHPKAQTLDTTYRIFQQPGMNQEQFEAFKERVKNVSSLISRGNFEARVEHHCQTSRNKPSCAIHIIPPVSYL
ncbi:MAG TPA: PD-(D/E)XK nuclease family protein [Microbacteriaceae bacterium]|nr:PD-(D/E)XK nuclease family protein [Microbacteriaceae bacterium]